MNARQIPWRRWMPWIVVAILVLMGIALIVPAIEQGRESQRKSLSKNNLRTLGLSFHNYHSSHECLPPGGTFGEDGSARHGWGIAIWPFMESQSYRLMIDSDAPWDAPPNSYIFKAESYIFASPNIPLLCTNEGFAPSHYIGNQNLLYRNSAVTFGQMENGLAHTWLLADQFQDWWPWGSPYNWGPLEWPRTGSDTETGWSGGSAMLVMADGSVQTFSKETAPEVIQALREAPPVPIRAQIEKPANPYHFDSSEWKREEFDNDDSNSAGRFYCRAAISPSGEIDSVWYYIDDFSVEGSTPKAIEQILKRFPEPNIMVLHVALDDELLNQLLRNRKLKILRVSGIELSPEGIERLKEFFTLEYLSGETDLDTLEVIQQALPDLTVRNRSFW